MRGHFKLLEDMLGAIDYYDAFAKQFAIERTVSADVTRFAESKSFEKTGLLNDLLIKKGWIGKKPYRIAKLRKRLSDVDWLDERSEIKAIETYYRGSIDKTKAFARLYEKGFTELETQVHELRRKLRWLSIYPQALRGCIQLDETPTNDKNVDKYLVPDVVNSPFNKMPVAGTNTYLLMFHKDYFLALSWMIAELGKLKDEGLRTVLIAEAGKKRQITRQEQRGDISKIHRHNTDILRRKDPG